MAPALQAGGREPRGGLRAGTPPPAAALPRDPGGRPRAQGAGTSPEHQAPCHVRRCPLGASGAQGRWGPGLGLGVHMPMARPWQLEVSRPGQPCTRAPGTRRGWYGWCSLQDPGRSGNFLVPRRLGSPGPGALGAQPGQPSQSSLTHCPRWPALAPRHRPPVLPGAAPPPPWHRRDGVAVTQADPH